MQWFHVSVSLHEKGKTIQVPSGQDAIAYSNSHPWLEEVLESARNGRAVSRKRAVYAANSLAGAGYFLGSQHKGCELFGYKVSLSSPTSTCPMALIGRIKDVGQDFAQLNTIAAEYWASKNNWQFLEAVCDSLTVTEVIGKVNIEDCSSGQLDFDTDRLLAKKLWPAPTRKMI